ncbi:MAG: hypothetical protein WDO13_15925 [Verrucomicrobiota bacterium]
MPAFSETAVWKDVDGTWRRVYGSFADHGASIEWHDFSTAEDIDWSASFHPSSLEVCLNFSGAARMQHGGATHEVGAGQITVCATGDRAIRARRLTGHLHDSSPSSCRPATCARSSAPSRPGLKPEIRAFLEHPERARSVVQVETMPAPLLSCRSTCWSRPCPRPRATTWYHSKTNEILAHLFFRPEPAGELFCQRHQRLNRERCERVLFLLERDLEKSALAGHARAGGAVQPLLPQPHFRPAHRHEHPGLPAAQTRGKSGRAAALRHRARDRRGDGRRLLQPQLVQQGLRRAFRLLSGPLPAPRTLLKRRRT